MKDRRLTLAEFERLSKALPGNVRRFVTKKLKGRENVRGAKARAIADAAEEFFKDTRSIERYLKLAGPLQDSETVLNASMDILRQGLWRDPKEIESVGKACDDALAMLAVIQKHLTLEDRKKCSRISDEVIDVYNIALIKAGGDGRPRLPRKPRIVHDRK